MEGHHHRQSQCDSRGSTGQPNRRDDAYMRMDYLDALAPQQFLQFAEQRWIKDYLGNWQSRRTESVNDDAVRVSSRTRRRRCDHVDIVAAVHQTHPELGEMALYAAASR
jgi:hypothetical protein